MFGTRCPSVHFVMGYATGRGTSICRDRTYRIYRTYRTLNWYKPNPLLSFLLRNLANIDNTTKDFLRSSIFQTSRLAIAVCNGKPAGIAI